MRQDRLRRYGHIPRIQEGNKVKQTMKMEVRGTQAKGRPRMRWMDNIRHDMTKCGLEERDTQAGKVEEGGSASYLDKGE